MSLPELLAACKTNLSTVSCECLHAAIAADHIHARTPKSMCVKVRGAKYLADRTCGAIMWLTVGEKKEKQNR